jgi:hypothetical protein
LPSLSQWSPTSLLSCFFSFSLVYLSSSLRLRPSALLDDRFWVKGVPKVERFKGNVNLFTTLLFFLFGRYFLNRKEREAKSRLRCAGLK